ncbi:MAG TPA: ankyrin repeat domain-containing protein [Patescibacteria group bacterium]|nr:ankyrin repeat domain-containing protein [Patescibacteria group bacterium]
MPTPAIPDLNGITPLMRAAAANDSSRIAELVAEGHDVNAKDAAGSSALIYGVANDGEEAALMLMFHKADLSATNRNAETALIIAARKQMNQVVQRWAVMGAPFDAQENQHGRTALMTAIVKEDIWAACRLVDAGADFDTLKDFRGDTALSLAKLKFAGEDLGYFMHAVDAQRAAANAATRAQKAAQEEIAHGAGALTKPIAAPHTASFRRKSQKPLP